MIEIMFERGQTYFGIRFKLGAFEHYEDIKDSELIGISIPLDDVIHFEGMNRLFSDIGIEQRAEIISNSFTDINGVPKLVKNILSLIYEQDGNITFTINNDAVCRIYPNYWATKEDFDWALDALDKACVYVLETMGE